MRCSEPWDHPATDQRPTECENHVFFSTSLKSIFFVFSNGTSSAKYGESSQDEFQEVRIGAFNVQRLGEKKFTDSFVVDTLLKVVSRYHILLIQEVFDEEEKHIGEFVQQLSNTSGFPYACVVSDRLGRKRYKEQYLYIYRSVGWISIFLLELPNKVLEEVVFESKIT